MNRKALRLLVLVALLAVLIMILVRGTIGGFSMPLLKEIPTDTILDETFDLADVRTVSIDLAATNLVLRVTDAPTARVVFESNLPVQNRARITAGLANDTLTVREDYKFRIGLFFNTFEQVTLYLPKDFHERLDIRMLSGRCAAEGELSVRDFAFKMSSGKVTLGDVRCATYDISSLSGALEIGALGGDGKLSQSSGSMRIEAIIGNHHEIRSLSGSMRIGAIRGNATVSHSSGSMQIDALSGAGSFTSLSGSMRIAVAELLGDLAIKSSSGSTRVTLPRDASFHFTAHSSSGSVRTDFPASHDGKDTSATVGDAPIATIRCESASGSIRLGYE